VALLDAGYWHTTYWALNYWNPDYWLHYGAYMPPPSVTEVAGGVTVSHVSDDLAMLALVLIARRRRKRNMII